MSYELNTRYTVTMPQGTIDQEGIGAIVRLISAQRANEGEWKDANPDTKWVYLPPLPDSWQWTWIVTGKGDYVGTFPKRVRKFYFESGLKCPDSFIEMIGRIAREHSGEAVTYEFEIVDEIDWVSGDFGDGGSCYWGSNEGGKDMLTDNGGLALCFYKTGTDEGIGRAWFVPQKRTSGDEFHVVFNGYGFNGDSTLTIARIVAMFLNCTYKRIRLVNNGIDSGTLWINSTRGYAVGAVEIVDSIERWDFQWYDEDRYTCSSCGVSLGEDDIYRGADDEDYCQSCFYCAFETCNYCGEPMYQDDAQYAEDETWCDRCFDRHFTHCAECDEVIRHEDTVSLDEGVFCGDCADRVISERESEDKDEADETDKTE